MRRQCALLLVTLTLTAGTVDGQTTALTLRDIEGVFEVTSDKLTDVRNRRTTDRTAEGWVGLWILKDGYFSETTMNRKRSSWVATFPQTASEIGMIAAAGTYSLNGNVLQLEPAVYLVPGTGAEPLRITIRKEGDTLTFTESIHSTRERSFEGQRIRILKRVPSLGLGDGRIR